MQLPIEPIPFLAALCIGLLYVYLTSNKTRVVVRYPTPFNQGSHTYRDDSGMCFRYRLRKVECPADQEKIKLVPIQQGVTADHLQVDSLPSSTSS